VDTQKRINLFIYLVESGQSFPVTLEIFRQGFDLAYLAGGQITMNHLSLDLERKIIERSVGETLGALAISFFAVGILQGQPKGHLLCGIKAMGFQEIPLFS